MFHDVNLILILVFLHIEHFPEFLQLMEFAEGFQDDQHGNESEEKVACDPNLVQLSELLVVAFPWHVIPQADGAQRDEAEVKGFEEVPVILQHREHSGWDEEEAGYGDESQQNSVDDGHHLLGEAPADVEVEDGSAGDMHGDTLNHSRQEEEGERDTDDRVDDAESLAPI